MSSAAIERSDLSVNDVQDGDSQTYSGLVRRGVAFVIDALVVLFLVWLVLVLAGFVLGLAGYDIEPDFLQASTQTSDDTTRGLRLLVALGYIVYFTTMEARRGATFGKRLLGIRVTTLTGESISWMASFIRNLIRPIDLIGGFLFARGARRQRLGDRAANTVVVRRS